MGASVDNAGMCDYWKAMSARRQTGPISRVQTGKCDEYISRYRTITIIMFCRLD